MASFEDADFLTGPSEISGTHEAVVAAANDDRVEA
jgi:hypothetical protein